MELGDQNGNFARDVFSTILKVKEHLKMAKAAETYGKCTKERMEDILRRLEEMRADANIMDKDISQKEKDKGSGGGTGNGSGSRAI